MYAISAKSITNNTAHSTGSKQQLSLIKKNLTMTEKQMAKNRSAISAYID